MAPGVLSSACLATGKPYRQTAHPADLRSPLASTWGEDSILKPRAPKPPGKLHHGSELEDYFEQVVAAKHPLGLSVAVAKDGIGVERPS